MSSKFNEYPIIPYPRVMWVCFNAKAEDVKERFIDLRGEVFNDLLGEDSQMQTWDVEDKESGRYGYLVCCKSKDKAKDDYLSHEACHVAVDLFRVIGCDVCDATQEPFAYLQQFLFNCLRDSKKKKYVERGDKKS